MRDDEDKLLDWATAIGVGLALGIAIMVILMLVHIIIGRCQ